MKVFLSWSGAQSHQVALALREWLPNVIQALVPWMSSEDIEKGARWSAEIAMELATTKAGIICITSTNRAAPWLNFEAGALSKTIEKEMVCPYLFRLKPSDLTWPLAQFQAAEANREGTLRLLKTLNGAETKPLLPESKLLEFFEVWWPRLEHDLRSIKADKLDEGVPARGSDEILQEVLEIVRDQARTGQEDARKRQEDHARRRREIDRRFDVLDTQQKSLLTGLGRTYKFISSLFSSQPPKSLANLDVLKGLVDAAEENIRVDDWGADFIEKP